MVDETELAPQSGRRCIGDRPPFNKKRFSIVVGLIRSMETRMRPMKVVLADDHQLFRHCLRTCLCSTGIEVVAEATDGLEAVAAVQAWAPDVLVLDISMPKLGGFDVVRKLRELDAPTVHTVALSMHSEYEFVAEASRLGIDGYVAKSSAYEELVGALEVVVKGGTYLSPQLAPRKTLRPAVELSSSESKLITLIAEGLHVKEIAAREDVSDKTVHARRAKLMRKLGAQSVADLVKIAIRIGLVDVG
jgi:DNA-binding NarL/FixJ family response regulator